MREALRTEVFLGNFQVLYESPREHGGVLAFVEVWMGEELYNVWFEDVPGFNAPIILDWELSGAAPW